MYFQRSIGAPTLQQALLKSSRQSLVWGLSVVGGACVGPQGGGRSLGGGLRAEGLAAAGNKRPHTFRLKTFYLPTGFLLYHDLKLSPFLTKAGSES